MGWLTKILKGSSHKGKYHENYGHDRTWDEPRNSVEEEINVALAISLSELDHKGRSDNEDKSPSEDDEQSTKAELDNDEPPSKIQSDDEPPAKTESDHDEPPAEVESDHDEPPAEVESDHDDQSAKIQLVEDEQLALAIQESLKVDSPPRYDSGSSSKIQSDDEPPAKTESDHDEPPAEVESDHDDQSAKIQLEEDEQLALAIQESLKVNSPPRYDSGSSFQPYLNPAGTRICAGCKSRIGHGRYLSCVGAFWHPDCFCCRACNLPITDYEFSMSGNHPYHKSCYKEQHHPRCDVCKSFIPTNSAGLIEYRAHPFWLQKYCPSHERDRTPRCCSCERMEPRDTKYLLLDDGRKLCLECLDSAIMDTHECQPLYLEIQEFYEGLNMKVEQQVPMLLVERQALNEAMEGEKNGHHHLPETRGLCLSEEQTVTTILRRPKIGAGYRMVDMVTEPYRLVRHCEVTAILVLYGLPRLLTGSILAHEMMHAWLRLKGYQNLSPKVEEGICQVLAHMWLDAEMYSVPGSDVASSSSSSSSSASSSNSGSSKKGKRSDFEKKLGEFFKHQIESDSSTAYGEGFRIGNQAVLKYGLRRTLDHIRLTGSYP